MMICMRQLGTGKYEWPMMILICMRQLQGQVSKYGRDMMDPAESPGGYYQLRKKTLRAPCECTNNHLFQHIQLIVDLSKLPAALLGGVHLAVHAALTGGGKVAGVQGSASGQDQQARRAILRYMQP